MTAIREPNLYLVVDLEATCDDRHLIPRGENETIEMGAVLVRSAFSANIKERRDCSTALFDERGRMVTQAEHIPVHLGAMPEAVAACSAASSLGSESPIRPSPPICSIWRRETTGVQPTWSIFWRE